MNKTALSPLLTACLSSATRDNPLHREPPIGRDRALLGTSCLSMSTWEPPWRRHLDRQRHPARTGQAQPAVPAVPKNPMHREDTAPRPAPAPRASGQGTMGVPAASQNPMHRERGAGPLRNGNPRGNPNLAPRCGAKTRAGCPCRAPAMGNGRCRMHGGAATGPRTAAGRARIAAARTRHGRYGAAVRAQRARIATVIARGRVLNAVVKAGLPLEVLAPLLPAVMPAAGGRPRGNTPCTVNPMLLMALPLTAAQGRELVRRVRTAMAPPAGVSVGCTSPPA